MATVSIWPGSSSFATYSSSYSSGTGSLPPTPFGFYDNDLTFQSDANKIADYIARRLGYPLVDIELQQVDMWSCFEDSITEFSSQLFQGEINENLINLIGAQTSSGPLNNQVVTPNLSNVITLAKQYGTEAGSGGNLDYKKGYIEITSSQQRYDLQKLWADVSESGNRIEIKKVYNEAPPAIVRYFDPYAGTGTGLESLIEAFGFGNYSPGINFLLMPINYDVLKMQAIEFNDQIRKSQYSFKMENNTLCLFPIPTRPIILFFDYIVEKDRANPIAPLHSGSTDLITNASNVPYATIDYSTISSPWRKWIFDYSVALAKEMLGYIRGKYNNSVPLPGDTVNLNAPDLLSDARTEKEKLITTLQEMFDKLGRQKQIEKRASIEDNQQKILNNVPMVIYVK
tara:strand:+ start:4038 stop:5234 length:1197 start_codon:yes stop_codon:yes gene_type:complete